MGGSNLLIQHRKQISKELKFNSFEYQIQSKKIINMLINKPNRTNERFNSTTKQISIVKYVEVLSIK